MTDYKALSTEELRERFRTLDLDDPEREEILEEIERREAEF